MGDKISYPAMLSTKVSMLGNEKSSLGYATLSSLSYRQIIIQHLELLIGTLLDTHYE